MSEKYYNPTIYDPYYPTIVKSIFDTIQVYICNVLYGNEAYRIAKDRFIQVDFTGGDDASIRRSIEVFKTSQAKFPFTAYGIEDLTSAYDKGSHKERSGTYYSNLYECYVKSIPAKITIPMVTFYTTAFDYDKAIQKFYAEACILIRLNVPININDNNVYFPIDVDFDISKGQFAGAFDEYLKVGNIFGLNHNFIISFRHFLINANDQHGNTPTIALVDDIIASFYAFNHVDYRDRPTLLDTQHSYDIPIVSSSTPTLNATGVSRTANIVLNFNVGMDTASIESYIDFDPFIVANYSWNSLNTILTIEIVETLLANTEYTITLPTNVVSAMQQQLEYEHNLIFTTGN